jgi:hypothetical protein
MIIFINFWSNCSSTISLPMACDALITVAKSNTIELDAAGAKHESSDGRADAEQDCGCQAGDFKRSFFD